MLAAGENSGKRVPCWCGRLLEVVHFLEDNSHARQQRGLRCEPRQDNTNKVDRDSGILLYPARSSLNQMANAK